MTCALHCETEVMHRSKLDCCLHIVCSFRGNRGCGKLVSYCPPRLGWPTGRVQPAVQIPTHLISVKELVVCLVEVCLDENPAR